MSRLSELNSCILKGKFDFSISTTTGKWSTEQEVYRLNALRMDNANNIEAAYGYSVIEKKTKVHGRGKALILRFESTEGKDFELLGWAIPVTGQGKE